MSDYSSTFPTQRPSLNLDFANGGDQLDSRISFSRPDTPPTYAAPSAVHYWSNEKHLSTENLFENSNVYDSVGWYQVRVDQTIGQADPAGGTSAKMLNQASGQTDAGVAYWVGTVGADELTFSIFLKPNGRTKPNLSENLTDSSNALKRTYFDLTGIGAVGTSDAAHTASITKFGDWYRCTIKFTPHAADSGSVYMYASDTDNSQTVADDGNGYIVFGANLSTTGQLVTNETSGQKHRSYSSTLKSVTNAGDPRFEYDPADGQSDAGSPRGLLIEAQSTNYIFPSENITGWSAPGNMTVSANSMVAPNGTLTADVLTVSDDTVASGHFAYRSSSAGTSGETVAVSFFAKSAGVNQIYFYDNGVGAASVSIFDLSNGTIAGANASNCKMIDCGNGWYRCVSVYTLTGTGEQLRFYTFNGTSTTYIANGFDGFALWGVQVEQASSESSYIGETVSSTITRASDSCSVATSSFYTGGPVSIVAEANMTSPTMNPPTKSVFELGDGTSDNRIWVYNNFSKADSLYVRADGVTGMFEAGTVTTDDDFTVAARVDTNNSGRSTNGGSVTSDTSVVIPSGLDTLYIGRSKSTSVNALNGHIKRVSLYSAALSDVELQSLTSNP